MKVGTLLRSVGIGICLLASVASCGDDPNGSAEPAPTISVRTIPEQDADLEPGIYRVSKEGRAGSDPLKWSIVDFTVELPDGLVGNTGHSVGTPEEWEESRPADSFGFYPLLVDSIYADPCEGEAGATQPVGPKPGDLVKALLAQPGTDAAVPVKTTIGGLPATRIDLEVPRGADLSSCHLADFGPPALQIWFADQSDKYFVLSPGLHARVYVADVDGMRQEFLAVHSAEPSAAALQRLDAIVASIDIE
jgi:hypothetical protein